MLFEIANAILSTVINAENVDDIVMIRSQAIDDNVWQSHNHQLTCSGDKPMWAKVRKIEQQADGPTNSSDHATRCFRISLTNVGVNVVELATRAPAVTDPHSPHFFQSATISSSLAKSPASAS